MPSRRLRRLDAPLVTTSFTARQLTELKRHEWNGDGKPVAAFLPKILVAFVLAADKVEGEEEVLPVLFLHVLRAASEDLCYHLWLLVDGHGTDIAGERRRSWWGRQVVYLVIW